MRSHSSRLSLYAIISSIEEDLRNVICEYVGHKNLNEIILEGGQKELLLARQLKEVGHKESNSKVNEMATYLDYGDSYAFINANKQSFPEDIAKYVRTKTEVLSKIVPIRNRVMHSRPLSLGDIEIVYEVADQITKDNGKMWSKTQTILSQLEVDPSFVLGLSIPEQAKEDRTYNNLPLPDFDETGLIGRDDVVKRIKKLCKGPMPVISIVGEGGIGKSAVALKVAYDILDESGDYYDAIIWATSKSTQLAATEIVEIKDAIKDSLGLFSELSTQVGGVADNPLEELVEYMESFRLLIFIDNLETIIDDKVRQFMESISAGSKVIITSRIGMGAYEVPIKLDGIEERYASQLCRQLGISRNVILIKQMEEGTLRKYCSRMHCNPGYIKWFVSCVQAGRSPDEILQNSSKFLEFCMSNVHDKLTPDAKELAGVMQCVSGARTLLEWSAFCDHGSTGLLRSMQELLSTNMISVLQKSLGSVVQVTYQLSELARSFLAEHHKVDAKVLKSIAEKKNKLSSYLDFTQSGVDKYNPSSFKIRNKHDRIAVRRLMEALRLIHEDNLTPAHVILSELKQLYPDYFEIHRVYAFYYTRANSIADANKSYLLAITQEPSSPQLRYLYARFLNEYDENRDEAIAQLLASLEIDRKSVPVMLELARLYMYALQFENADKMLTVVKPFIDESGCTLLNRKIFYSLLLQLSYRKADGACKQRSFDACVLHLKEMMTVFDSVPRDCIDSRLIKSVCKASRTAEYLSGTELSVHSARVFSGFSSWLDGFRCSFAR